MKSINILGISKKIILSTINDRGIHRKIMMMPITEEQEEILDKDNYIDINEHLRIPKNNIYVYGEVNFSEEDIAKIEKTNIVPEDGGWIYSGVDLNTGVVEFEGKVPKQYQTFDPVIWFTYNYLIIGKPKRIIIFKCLKTDKL